MTFGVSKVLMLYVMVSEVCRDMTETLSSSDGLRGHLFTQYGSTIEDDDKKKLGAGKTIHLHHLESSYVLHPFTLITRSLRFAPRLQT